MSGTAKVNNDKDGIFGSYLNAYDGSVFRRILSTTTGLLIAGQRPSSGYAPIQINASILVSAATGNVGIAVLDKTIYTVPANMYFYFGSVNYVKTLGTQTTCTLIVSRGGVLTVIDEQGALALGVYVPKQYNNYIDDADILFVRLNVTVNPSAFTFYLNGYLIPKT